MTAAEFPDQALSALSAGPDGLSEDEAEKRLSEYGKNRIECPGKSPFRTLLLRRAREPMTYILLLAVVLSLLLRRWTDAALVFLIIAAGLAVTVLREAKAARMLEEHRRLTALRAVVRRSGKTREIDAAELVPGDVVLLCAGQIVPADLRILGPGELTVDESALNGEQTPVRKTALADAGDRAGMAYMTTVVLSGSGEGVVQATAGQTEIGRMAGLCEAEEEGPTAMQHHLGELARLLGLAAGGACVLLLVAGLLSGRGFGDMLMSSVALAVAAVPEGMGALVAISLAAGAASLAGSGIYIRRLHAAETLGSVNIICTDKAGILTQNRMAVHSFYMYGRLCGIGELELRRHAMLVQGLVLCCDARIDEGRSGSPEELAFLDMAVAAGAKPGRVQQSLPREAELAFDPQRGRMTTLHRTPDGQTLSYTRGRPENVLPLVTQIVTPEGIRPVTGEDLEAIRAAVVTLSDRALQVVALCVRSGDEQPVERELVFVGLAGLSDPPHRETEEAVRSCREAGIGVVLFTADGRDTAVAAAKELGIVRDRTQVITGGELDGMGEEELLARAKEIAVYAGVTPAHKVRVARALKALGDTVAVTGTGMEDVPVLRAADVAMAMGGSGTGAAWGAADIVVTRGSFEAVSRVLAGGRAMLENIRRSILYLLTIGLGEMLAIFAAVVLGLGVPLSPVHILWINLVTGPLPSLALGIDPAGAHIMKQPPRNGDESIFARGGWFTVLLYGTVIGTAALTAYIIGLSRYEGLENRILCAQTYAFVVLAYAQLLHALCVHAGRRSVFLSRPHRSRILAAALALGFGLQALIVSVPALGGVFGTVPVTLSEWGLLIAFSILPVLVHEAAGFIRFFGEKFDGE